MKLYVDVSKRRLLDGLDHSLVATPRFFRDDVLMLEIILVSGGENVSSLLLSPASKLKVTIMDKGGLRVEATDFELKEDIARFKLDLTGIAMADYTNGSFGHAFVKIELAAVDESSRETLYLGSAFIQNVPGISGAGNQS